MEQNQVDRTDIRWLAWGLAMFAGLSMVSNFKFYSGKDINLRKSVPFSAVVAIAMGLVVIIVFASTLPQILFVLFTSYALSGYVLWLVELARRKPAGSPPPP
jgi:CDP-diacylglycerol--serine O-phosphatidyltransferase